MPADDVHKYYNYFLGSSKGNTATPLIYSRHGQKGAGLGSFLASIFRKVFPFIKSGAKAMGEEFLKSGVGVVSDNFRGKKLRDSLRDRVREAGTNLSDRAANKVESMLGGGIKRRRPSPRKQSTSRRGKKRTSGRVGEKRSEKRRPASKAKALKKKVSKKRSKKKKCDIFC
jgi:hypothetical protein